MEPDASPPPPMVERWLGCTTVPAAAVLPPAAPTPLTRGTVAAAAAADSGVLAAAGMLLVAFCPALRQGQFCWWTIVLCTSKETTVDGLLVLCTSKGGSDAVVLRPIVSDDILYEHCLSAVLSGSLTATGLL